MPYILSTDRTLEISDEKNYLEQAAHALRAARSNAEKSVEARDFIAYLIDTVYGEPCFESANLMARNVPQPMVVCANILASNIVNIHERDGGREGLLNYTLTRFFNEAYPAPRYKDFNAIAGILTSLLRLAHPGHIELLGLLVCCRDEYYRKYAGPYEDKKETQNGAVAIPVVAPPTDY